MSKRNPKANPTPAAIRRGGYVHHIATNIKRRGFTVRYEVGGKVARIIFNQPAERGDVRRAA